MKKTNKSDRIFSLNQILQKTFTVFAVLSISLTAIITTIPNAMADNGQGISGDGWEQVSVPNSPGQSGVSYNQVVDAMQTCAYTVASDQMKEIFKSIYNKKYDYSIGHEKLVPTNNKEYIRENFKTLHIDTLSLTYYNGEYLRLKNTSHYNEKYWFDGELSGLDPEFNISVKFHLYLQDPLPFVQYDSDYTVKNYSSFGTVIESVTYLKGLKIVRPKNDKIYFSYKDPKTEKMKTIYTAGSFDVLSIVDCIRTEISKTP